MTEATSISRHFSRAAERYAREAETQRRFAETLAARLPVLADGDRVLEIGCGTGFLTALLAKRYPACVLEGIDISATMLASTKSALQKNSGSIVLHHGDVREYPFTASFALVTSCSAIHWIRPYHSVFKKVRGLLSPGGSFFFSLMVHGTLGELHDLRRDIFPHKVPRAGLPTCMEVQSELEESGFAVSLADEQAITATYRDAEAFIDFIRGTGLTGGAVSTGYTPLTRLELMRLSEAYQSRYSTASGEVRATYRSATFRATC